MAKHKSRFALDALLGKIAFQVDNHAADSTADVVKVHRGRAHAGVFWAFIRPSSSLLSASNNTADGPAAQASSSKSEGFEKAVVELLP